MKRIILFLAIVIAGASPVATAQDAAVKTNLLSDAFLNPALGFETGLSVRDYIVAKFFVYPVLN